MAINSESLNVPNIPALTSEVNRLQNATNWWAEAALWLTAVTAFVGLLYFVASRIAINRGNQLRIAQSNLSAAEAGRLAANLTAKDLKIAAAGQKASEADARARAFEQEAARLTADN